MGGSEDIPPSLPSSKGVKWVDEEWVYGAVGYEPVCWGAQFNFVVKVKTRLMGDAVMGQWGVNQFAGGRSSISW